MWDKIKPVPKVTWQTAAGIIVAIAGAVYVEMYGVEPDAEWIRWIERIGIIGAGFAAGWLAPRE